MSNAGRDSLSIMATLILDSIPACRQSCGKWPISFVRKDETNYPRFRDRIQNLNANSGSIGWGYGDLLSETVFDIECCFREK